MYNFEHIFEKSAETFIIFSFEQNLQHWLVYPTRGKNKSRILSSHHEARCSENDVSLPSLFSKYEVDPLSKTC